MRIQHANVGATSVVRRLHVKMIVNRDGNFLEGDFGGPRSCTCTLGRFTTKRCIGDGKATFQAESDQDGIDHPEIIGGKGISRQLSPVPP